jgi:hypothetical protein
MNSESIKKMVEDSAMELHESIQVTARAKAHQKLTAKKAKTEMALLVDAVANHVDITKPAGQIVLMKVIAKYMVKSGSDMPPSEIGGDW